MTLESAVKMLLARGLAARKVPGEQRILGGRSAGMAAGVPVYLDSFAIDAAGFGWVCRFAGGLDDEEQAAASLEEAVEVVTTRLDAREQRATSPAEVIASQDT
jgi:hypothetical protein